MPVKKKDNKKRAAIFVLAGGAILQGAFVLVAVFISGESFNVSVGGLIGSLTIVLAAAGVASIIYHGLRFWNLFLLPLAVAGHLAGPWLQYFDIVSELVWLALFSLGLWLLITTARESCTLAPHRRAGEIIIASGLLAASLWQLVVGGALRGDYIYVSIVVFALALGTCVGFGPRLCSGYFVLLAMVAIYNFSTGIRVRFHFSFVTFFPGGHYPIHGAARMYITLFAVALLALGLWVLLKKWRKPGMQAQSKFHKLLNAMVFSGFALYMFALALPWHYPHPAPNVIWQAIRLNMPIAIGFLLLVKYLVPPQKLRRALLRYLNVQEA